MSNDCIYCLEVFVHDNEADDFTWVDLGSLLVDKKPKLVCLLEHIVLRLSLDQESTPAANCTAAVCSAAWKGCGEERTAGERFLRARLPHSVYSGCRTILLFCAAPHCAICHRVKYSSLMCSAFQAKPCMIQHPTTYSNKQYQNIFYTWLLVVCVDVEAQCRRTIQLKQRA